MNLIEEIERSLTSGDTLVVAWAMQQVASPWWPRIKVALKAAQVMDGVLSDIQVEPVSSQLKFRKAMEEQ